MERFLIVGLLFCLEHTFVCAITEDRYFLIGKSLELKPPPNVGNIESIAWRHKGNFVAEYAKDTIVLEIYGAFKGRTDLNITTGNLQISNTNANDAGEFSLEINSNKLDVQYIAKAIDEVPKPYVWVKPKDENLLLICEVKNGEKTDNLGPVTYFWDIGGGGKNWTKGDQRVSISNNETTQAIKTFSCKMVNPVSEKESEPKENPFYNNGSVNTTTRDALLGVFGVLVVVVVGGFLAYKNKEKLLNMLPLSSNRGNVNPNMRNGQLEPLNQNPNDKNLAGSEPVTDNPNDKNPAGSEPVTDNPNDKNPAGSEPVTDNVTNNA